MKKRRLTSSRGGQRLSLDDGSLDGGNVARGSGKGNGGDSGNGEDGGSHTRKLWEKEGRESNFEKVCEWNRSPDRAM